MNDSLFKPPRPGEDRLYARIRDHVREEPYRQRLEEMWSVYRDYAPKGFPKMLQVEFHQRWWEMYLTLGLLKLGILVRTCVQDKGPDLAVEHGNTKVWIEAVAPKPGETSDAVPEPLANGVSDLPKRECLLRFTQAITDKRDKFSRYIERGIVSEADCLIVAVSACNLNQFGTFLDYPQPVMLQVLAGAGDPAIPLDRSAPPYFQRKNTIDRDSGSPVGLALFDCSDFGMLAGVLYSSEDPLNASATPEESLELFLNPRGSVQVPVRIVDKLPTWLEKTRAGQAATWTRTTPDTVTES